MSDLQLKPLHNSIIFQFLDDVVIRRGVTQFQEKTNWGFQISSYDESCKKPRWGVVLAVGPTVDKSITVGTKILIEALKWTESHEHEGIKFWRTNDEQVMAIDED